MRLLFAAVAIVVTQTPTPDLGGTWKLDEARSSVSQEATITGLIGTGAPGVLHVTQPENGTLVVESQVNESHSRLYVPGGETTTPVFLGAPGTITMKARWDGRALVSEGTRSSSSTESPVRETFSLSEDGRILTVEISLAGAESTLRYTRIQSVGPCDSWPSPCKDFSSLERR